MTLTRILSKRTVVAAAVLVSLSILTAAIAMLFDAQYDDRRFLLQLTFWLTAGWVFPILTILCLGVGLVRGFLNRETSRK